MLRERGVRFLMNTTVDGLRRSPHGVEAFSGGAALPADHVVLASGAGAARLLKPIGIRAAIYLIKGYSLTFELQAQSTAPHVSITDSGRKVVYARLELLARNDVDGVVVTHGTDTIEETSYFLHLTLKSAKPVVVVGSMRPPSAMSSDAALNLYDALAVAAHPSSRGLGALVVANSEIHTARDVVKSNSFKLDAFRSPYGALGIVIEGTPRYYRRPARAHTLDTPWSIDTLRTLPKVDIVYAYGALESSAVAAIAKNARGLVFAGTGNGNIAGHLIGPLRDAARRGVRVVRASRTGNGVVLHNAAQPDDEYGWLTVDDQAPLKARLLLTLALTQTDDTNALQAVFERY